MKNKITLDWLIAAVTRALKTVAQTALGMFTVGVALYEVNWAYVVSVSLVAGIYSLLTSLAGLPEVGTDGVIHIDKTNPEKDTYLLDLNVPLEELDTKKLVKLTVDPNAAFSQK